MTKITFLGACREIGRSGVLVESNNGEKCLLDYGIRFHGDERLPLKSDLSGLKAVAVSHCHVDHSGALPYITMNYDVPILTNPITLNISKILIKDSIRISDYYYPYGYGEVNRMMGNGYFLDNKIRKKIGHNFYITFYNAGHIPGSVMILVEVDGKRILYTGDYNIHETNLISPANSDLIPEVDTVISESTYALREHPPREQLERDFVGNIIRIIENGGKVLIPAFAVARSQEVLMIIEKYGYRGRLYLDGLAKKVSEIYLRNPDYLRDRKGLKRAVKHAKFVSRRTRAKIKDTNGVIVAPSGMLKGGPSINFVKSFVKDPAAAIYVVGYQVEGTPGRKLLDEGIFEYYNNGKKKKKQPTVRIKAKCDTEYYDFSGHTSGTKLHSFIENLSFHDHNRKVFCIHGDPKATTTLAKDLTEDFGYMAVAPEIGESYKI
ncbi:MAG: MBL fold metallo-hydrolase [Promethearchaeia archaeon]